MWLIFYPPRFPIFELQPSARIIYQAMLDARIENGGYWNWGGTETQKGVYDFKKSGEHLIIRTITLLLKNATKARYISGYSSEFGRYYPGFYVVNFERLNINE